MNLDDVFGKEDTIECNKLLAETADGGEGCKALKWGWNGNADTRSKSFCESIRFDGFPPAHTDNGRQQYDCKWQKKKFPLQGYDCVENTGDKRELFEMHPVIV
jgi:hypothetical protein